MEVRIEGIAGEVVEVLEFSCGGIAGEAVEVLEFSCEGIAGEAVTESCLCLKRFFYHNRFERTISMLIYFVF